ncbi:transcription factor CPC-like [Gossypium australe]|uniref:Transcription factor CPC-like n=1 Tax=Gossypium australe TaxID=47621 RepID=A0A5B6WB07_9ROSI|nr:transcription factor CPC-like [Gossypium australe]
MGDFDGHGSSNGCISHDSKLKVTWLNHFYGVADETKVKFSEDEEMLIARMFNLVGQRWSLIAGRIPGRTAEEIEKYWLSKHNSPSENDT